MTTNASNNNTDDRRQWLSKCRSVLIEMETKNIRQRALSWTQIVNTETERINAMLGIDGSSISSHSNSNSNHHPHHNTASLPSIWPYSYTVPQPTKYLNFLTEWSGIKSRSASSSPSCYLEFESKAKNWLNGRRAPNYGNTLFPDMLTSAERYSSKLAQSVFGSVPIDKWAAAPISSSLCTLYQKALLFAFIEKLCSSRIAVHQNWKKTNLLCENSVKNQHSKTAKLLQQYAVHDHHGGPDLHSFPGNLQRAAAFFQQQHSKYLQRLIAAMNDHKGGHSLPPKMETNPFSTNQNQMGSSESGKWNDRRQRSRGGGDGTSPLVAIKERDYNAILQRLGALEQRHNDQAKEISNLTAKCTALQSRLEGAASYSQIPQRGDDASNSKTLTNSPSISHHSVHSMHSAPSNSSNHLKLPPSAPRMDYHLTPQPLPIPPPNLRPPMTMQLPLGAAAAAPSNSVNVSGTALPTPPQIHLAPRSAPTATTATTASSSSPSSFDGLSMMNGFDAQKPLELSYDWPPGPGMGLAGGSGANQLWTPTDRRLSNNAANSWSFALSKGNEEDMECHTASPSMTTMMAPSGDCNMTLMTSSTPNSAHMMLDNATPNGNPNIFAFSPMSYP